MTQQKNYLTINQERENRFNKAMYQLDVMLNTEISEKRLENKSGERGNEQRRE